MIPDVLSFAPPLLLHLHVIRATREFVCQCNKGLDLYLAMRVATRTTLVTTK